MIRFKTNFGSFSVRLFKDKAPKTVENFLRYVKEGHYEGTIFHRVINGFMVQGGGFEPGMLQKPVHDPVQNEANNGLKNTAYTIAMARTSDPHSATAQFFINVQDNDFLDFTAETTQGWGYCVFGEVIEGRQVIDSIKSVATTKKGMFRDVPVENIVIEHVELMDE